MDHTSSSRSLRIRCSWLPNKRSPHLWALLLASCEMSSVFGDWASFAPKHQPRLRGSADLESAAQRLLVNSSSNIISSTDSRSNSYGDDGDDRGPPTKPEQIHLALADARPRETYAMGVSWLTWADAKSQVFWGRDVAALEEVVTGNSTSECVTANASYWLSCLVSSFCVLYE